MKYMNKIKLKNILRYKTTSSFIMFFAISFFFYFTANGFFSVRNLSNLIEVVPELGLIVVGMTVLLIAGEFDLSVGSIFAFCPILLAFVINNLGTNLWISIALVILVSCLIGAINGIVTLKLQIPSFVTTLGGMMLYRGLGLMLTGGTPPAFPQKLIPLKEIMTSKTGPFINLFIFYVVVVAIIWLVLERSRYGNWIFATGADKEIAQMRGIDITKVKFASFVLASVLAGIAGIIQACRLYTILPTAGTGYELDAIAGAVIGGTSLRGGEGDLVGAFIGAFVIRSIGSGLVLMGAPGYYIRIFVSLVLVFAVVFQIFIKNKIYRMR